MFHHQTKKNKMTTKSQKTHIISLLLNKTKNKSINCTPGTINSFSGFPAEFAHHNPGEYIASEL